MNQDYTIEHWLPVPDERFADFYLISSEGRVRALDRVVTEVNGKQRIHKGRIITPKRTGLYLGVSLFSSPISERFYLHRLVAAAFVPNPENKPHVNHINFNRYDNRVSNLEWVTPGENTHHSRMAGRVKPGNMKKGEDHHFAGLSEEAVRWLRLTWEPYDSVADLSRKYGVTAQAIYAMLKGKTWKHVEPRIAINLPEGNEV